MTTEQKTIGAFIIASALIWGGVVLGCSLALRGTDCYDEISLILAGGAIFHLLFIWGPLAARLRKAREEE